MSRNKRITVLLDKECPIDAGIQLVIGAHTTSSPCPDQSQAGKVTAASSRSVAGTERASAIDSTSRYFKNALHFAAHPQETTDGD